MPTKTATAASLTLNEVAVLKQFLDNDYLGYDIDGITWSFSLRPADMAARSFSGVMASLSKKGLVKCWKDGGDDEQARLTETGLAAVRAMETAPPVKAPEAAPEAAKSTGGEQSVPQALLHTALVAGLAAQRARAAAFADALGRAHPLYLAEKDAVDALLVLVTAVGHGLCQTIKVAK